MPDPDTRLAEAARACGLDPEHADLAAMVGLLERVGAVPPHPGWSEEPGPPPELPAPATDGSPVITADALRRTVEDALARASLAAGGGAYTWLAGPEALGAAAEPAATRGTLAGFTLAVKDLIAVAGRPLTAGSAVRAGAHPEPRDAAVVAALRAAGCVVVGTTVCHEFAFGPSGVNDHWGTARNPHDPDRIAGGSSSGSALAVAEGSARVALGTDTGGSVRIPAALSGVVGFKPSYATYPADRVYPLAPSLDHVGTLARTVADVAAVHAALGHDHGEAVLPRRLGVLSGDLDGAEEPVAARVRGALEGIRRAGTALVEVDGPDPEEIFAASTAIMFAEAAAVHRGSMSMHAARYGADVRARLLAGLALPATAYVEARRRAADLRARMLDILAGVDALAGPCVPVTAPTVEVARTAGAASTLVRYTRLANVVGLPAISLPLAGDGLPVGLQVTAAHDAHLLGTAAAIEHLLAEAGP